MNRNVYVVGAKRTAIVPKGGALSHLSPYELGTPVLQALLDDTGLDPETVDDLICGNALGAGGNPARLMALAAGLPMRVGGLTLDRQCVSGLDAILLGADMIRSGRANLVIAGGAESYSRAPRRQEINPDGSLGNFYLRPAFAPPPFDNPDMAVAADTLGQSRSDQDRFAIESHRRALAAKSVLAEEIVPVGGVDTDLYNRKLTAATCARARAIHGNVTLANTAPAADGASFVILSPKPLAQASKPALRLLDGLTMGGPPERPGLVPITAARRLLERAKTRAPDLAQIELMEAYAAQALATISALNLNPKRVNPNGGALARGHPIGASGAVLATRMFTDLRAGQKGLATLAAAGGLGTAVLFGR